MKNHIIYIILAILSLPLFILASSGIQQLITRASPKAANIIIDTKNTLQMTNQSWNSFSQGGEEPPPMLSSTVSLMRKLSPRYIRLDHIYDYYSIVKSNDKKFSYDFTILDKTIDDIISSGALPFLSLSYMPHAFTTTGSVIDYPSDWNDWKNLVKATITHISGKNSRNLSHVYYEVWNEPELPQFGNFRLYGNKDYRIMYYYASLAAQEAENVNNFYIGGPAVGSYYSDWVYDFLSYVEKNNLRLDFYSWHRYSKNPSIYSSDAKNIRRDLSLFPKYQNIPLVLSEWGIDSENSLMNNGNIAAAYTVSAVSQFQDDLDMAFAFEVKDGPPHSGGKWGLISHEKDKMPLSPKPRFYAFEALSKITGLQISTSGDGTYVKVLASISKNRISALLTNFDLSDKNAENVPVTFTGLNPGSYNLKYTYLSFVASGNYEMVTTSGIISKSFIMPPNSILLLELTPLSDIATFIPGVSGKGEDKSLVLKNNSNPVVFSSPEFHLLPDGNISFYIKPLWGKGDNRSFLILEAPFATDPDKVSKLFLARQHDGENDNLVFGISPDNNVIWIDGDKLDYNSWHHIDLSWSTDGLSISIDNENKQIYMPLEIRNSKSLIFYPVDAALDNLKITVGNQLIERFFDGRADK